MNAPRRVRAEHGHDVGHLLGLDHPALGGHALERAARVLIGQYEADMAEVLAGVTPRTRDAVVALAELPLQIRGFGPVKMANAAKAEKRREELLATIRAGGPEMARAAE
jgi:indolepyruvate ferredoxin oxidoreductase